MMEKRSCSIVMEREDGDGDIVYRLDLALPGTTECDGHCEESCGLRMFFDNMVDLIGFVADLVRLFPEAMEVYKDSYMQEIGKIAAMRLSDIQLGHAVDELFEGGEGG